MITVKRLTALVVLGLLLVVGDRIGVTLAERAVAEQLRASSRLATLPDVDISGFPFLLQAARGSYQDVRVQAADVAAGRVRVAEFDARLSGLQIGLSDALARRVQRAPVDRLDATALVSYATVSAQSGERRLTVRAGPRPGTVAVSGAVVVLGRGMQATAISTVRLVEGALVITTEEVIVGAERPTPAVARALKGRLDLRVSIGALPYGLRATGVRAGSTGVTLTATARDTVISS